MSVAEPDAVGAAATAAGECASGSAVAGPGVPLPGVPGLSRTRSGTTAPPDAAVGAELRRMLAAGELDLPQPGAGQTARRWAALAAWGRRDLALARLAEGHVDALAILAEAGRKPIAGALYGVWASRAGGAAVRVEREGEAGVLRGTLRFCSGARLLDCALVVADPASEAPGERLLLHVDVRGPCVAPVPDSWVTAAMADADTLDVVFDGPLVGADDEVGTPGWYVARRGFVLGGAGVAAVWWGGAAGVLDRVLAHLRDAPDRHALAHVGELHAALAATDALLRHTAALIDADDGPRTVSDVVLAVATLRAAVERAVREVVDRTPRIVGPAPLSRDAGLARALADLALYVRQHHAERDHAALGEQVVDRWRTA
jgi:hypothetical protein